MLRVLELPIFVLVPFANPVSAAVLQVDVHEFLGAAGEVEVSEEFDARGGEVAGGGVLVDAFVGVAAFGVADFYAAIGALRVLDDVDGSRFVAWGEGFFEFGFEGAVDCVGGEGWELARKGAWFTVGFGRGAGVFGIGVCVVGLIGL